MPAPAAAPVSTLAVTAPSAVAPRSALTPTLSPEEEVKRFHLPAGYRAELVAAEPFVQEPVAIDFDADGRMWVVEMRGYMPNIKGTGEDQQVGRIVVLEDTDDDGRMDKATVFLDGLVLPRAIKVLERGVLVAAPPNLWLVRDTTGDLKADTKELVRSDYGTTGSNPEHNANGLLWGLDNWIHNANFGGQFRVARVGPIVFRETPEEGQWGVSIDEYGRMYRNSNEDPLRADLVSSHYATRNPSFGSVRGIYERLTTNVPVWPGHKTPAVNRGYRPETLRADSTLAHYTSAGSPTAYVGDRLPRELRRSVFVTEPAGNLVGRFDIREQEDGTVAAHTAYDHAEFMTADDERFRPVNLASAPDGTLYVVDMYRGIIQHRVFITGYLEQKIIERGLEGPNGFGRIWRIVHTSARRGERPRLSAKTASELVQYLAHPNGWWRMTAQRLLVERGDIAVAPALRALVRSHPDDRTRLHALWTLDGLGEVDAQLLRSALADTSPHVRAAAIRVSEPRLAEANTLVYTEVMRLLPDRAPVVRRQLAASLGELPKTRRDAAMLDVITRHGDDPIVADLVVTGLAGHELPFLEHLLASPAAREKTASTVVQSLSAAIVRAREGASVQRLLALAGHPTRPRWLRMAILAGAQSATGQRGGVTVSLPSTPSGLMAAMASADTGIRARARQVAESMTWPGKATTVVAARPLTAAERTRFVAGQQQYRATCAGCHQIGGMGLAGVAKSLVGSQWVVGSPQRLIRIVLHGKEGEMLMPPVGGSMTDDQVAAVLTYVRRSWGNTALPIAPEDVRDVRGATMGRTKPWTEAELSRIRR